MINYTWLFFALLAPIIFSIVQILTKYIVSNHFDDIWHYVMVYGLVNIIFLIIFPIKYVQLMPLEIMIYAIVAALLSIAGCYFYIKAVSIEEITRVIPLFRFMPLFVIIISYFFLSEKLPPLFLVAFTLIFIGSLLISVEKNALKITLRKAFYLMVASSVIYALVDVFIKKMFLTQNYWDVVTWLRLLIFFFTIILILFKWNSFKLLITKKAKPCMAALGIELLNLGALFSLFYAFSLGFVSLTTVIESFESFFVLVYALLLARWYPAILKEEFSKTIIITKVVAIILMFSGIMIIAFS